jgi:membrane-associated phospholipid phosphatase
MSATLVIIGLFLILVILTWTFGRWWEAHRKHPETVRRKAHAWWTRTGLHWSPPAYLTVQLIISLGATIAGLALFALLADWVTDQASITRLDLRVDNNLHAHASPLGVTIAKGVSFIGGPAAMAALMVAGAIYLVVRREKLLLYGWLVAFMGGGALDWALKTIFQRDRPSFPNPFVHAMGFSFPSGHSMGSLIGYGMLAYVIAHSVRHRGIDIMVAVCAGVLVVAIGFSRLYLGAHYLSDVLAGFAAGIVWLAANIIALEVSAPRPTAAGGGTVKPSG